MSREGRAFWAVLLSLLTLMPGCTPSRTFYFHEDGDLSHYRGVATNIEFPDIEGATLPEVIGTHPPLTLQNSESCHFWDLCLQDAVHTALTNSKVVRLLNLGTGNVNVGPLQVGGGPADRLLSNPDGAPTIYDPAIDQANPGAGGRFGSGVEAALSQFDAQLSSQVFWERNEQPQNVRRGDATRFFQRDLVQETANFQAQLSKATASGAAQFAVRNTTVYTGNNNPNREVISDYNTNFEVEARQPFLQGGGVLFNRIAGVGFPTGSYNGVVIARINSDISLADFEGNVQNQVKQVEDTYWELYGAYRIFDAAREGRDAVLKAWQRVNTLKEEGAVGGDALSEARARQEYLLFKSQAETQWSRLLEAENRLRYLMGLAHTDGRVIRPCEEPPIAKIDFDWCDIHCEALARQVNLRRQKWQIKRVEMELIAARNHLLPRLDGVARYRWLGLGDDLLDPNGPGIPVDNGFNDRFPGTNAFATLTDGNYQEWELGLEFRMPIGFRRELAGVRHAQLRLARERAVLQDQELEVSNLLAEAIRSLHGNHVVAETLFNRTIAARREVAAADTIFKEGAELQTQGPSILDRLLDAQRRRAESESQYYSTLAQYARSLTLVHFRKGSLLEYNNVFLTEGPWPCKAYVDATNRARERDSGLYMNYGYTRPSVISRGPYDQFGGQIFGHDGSLTPRPEEVPPPKNDKTDEGENDDPSGMQMPEPSVQHPDFGPRLGLDSEAPTPAAPLPTAPTPVVKTFEAEPTVLTVPSEPKARSIGFRPPRPR